MNIEIDYETADRITVATLKETIDRLQEEMDSDKEPMIFSFDPKEDRKQIKKMLKALKKVKEWYEVPNS